MEHKHKTISPEKFGKSIVSSVADKLKDSEYRKHYMIYNVRTAIAALIKSLRMKRSWLSAL